MDKIEYRAVIKFLTKQGKTPGIIFQEMRAVYGDSTPSLATVERWSKLFKWGKESLEDDPRPGRPVEATSSNIIEKVEQLVLENGRLKKKELAELTGISETSILNILHNHLNMSKVSARWVPKLLSALEKSKRVQACKDFVSLCGDNPAEIFSRIVTGDETWVHYYDPESKEESKTWIAKGSQPPRKARVQKSVGKVMATIFWDSKGILLIDYKETNEKITGEYYAAIIRKLRESVVQKRRGLMSKGVLLLHDNAPSHRAQVAMASLTECGFEQIDHPPYSPDLAPSDYYLFPKLKKDLRGKKFDTTEDLKRAINEHFDSKDENYFFTGLEMLLSRSKKCIKIKGEYIEK